MKKLFWVAAASLLAFSGAQAESFKHELGTVTLNGTPKRIVTLEYSFADALLSVGVKPVGIAQEASGSDLPYLDKQLGNVTIVGSRAQPSLEKILALKPDLIVADLDRHKSLYPQLSKIAPTLVLNSRLGSYNDILSQAALLGKVVGRDAQMQRRLKEHAHLLQRAEALSKPHKNKLMVVSARKDRLTAFDTDSFVGGMIGKLGWPNAFKTGDDVRAELSLEGLLALNPDTLVLLANKDEPLITDEWAKNPLWKSLSAVKGGRVYVFDRNLWTKGRGTQAGNIMLSQMLQSGFLTGSKPKDLR